MKASHRNRLEMRITEALDGEITAREIRQLEEELHEYPALLSQYRQLSDLPGMTAAFSHLRPPDFALGRLQTRLEAEVEGAGFTALLARYFRRYILTGAAVLMIGMLSARYFVNANTHESDISSGLFTTDTGEAFTDIPEYQFMMDLGTPSTADQPEEN